MYLLGSPAPPPPATTPGSSPNAEHVRDHMIVRDEWGCWQLGVLARQQDVVVELSFEMWQQHNLCFPHTAITYLRLDRGKQCLFEFQLGFTIVAPRDDIRNDLMAFLYRWVGYTPFRLPERRRRHPEETNHAYVANVSTRTTRRPSPRKGGMRHPMGRKRRGAFPL